MDYNSNSTNFISSTPQCENKDIQKLQTESEGSCLNINGVCQSNDNEFNNHFISPSQGDKRNQMINIQQRRQINPSNLFDRTAGSSVNRKTIKSNENKQSDQDDLKFNNIQQIQKSQNNLQIQQNFSMDQIKQLINILQLQIVDQNKIANSNQLQNTQEQQLPYNNNEQQLTFQYNENSVQKEYQVDLQQLNNQSKCSIEEPQFIQNYQCPANYPFQELTNITSQQNDQNHFYLNANYAKDECIQSQTNKQQQIPKTIQNLNSKFHNNDQQYSDDLNNNALAKQSQSHKKQIPDQIIDVQDIDDQIFQSVGKATGSTLDNKNMIQQIEKEQQVNALLEQTHKIYQDQQQNNFIVHEQKQNQLDIGKQNSQLIPLTASKFRQSVGNDIYNQDGFVALGDLQMFSDNYAITTSNQSNQHGFQMFSLNKENSAKIRRSSQKKNLIQIRPSHQIVSQIFQKLQNCQDKSEDGKYNFMQELISQSIIKLSQEKIVKLISNKNLGRSQLNNSAIISIQKNFINQKIMDEISFNKQNQLLQLADSHITDEQFEFVIQTLDVVIEVCQSFNQMQDQQHCVKALNFNGNSELTDASVRILAEFIQKHSDIKVLSIERIKASCGCLSTLFQTLCFSRIVELNVSGIPVSYFSIEQLCIVLQQNRSKIDL